MSILTHSPAIVRDGLVLCLDAGAVRSYPIFRGSNLITNGEFTTDTTGWAGYGGTTVSRVTASSDPGVPSGGTDDYCLKVSGTFMAYDPISTTTGKHYFVRLRGYDASGGNSLKISNTSDGASLTGVSSVTVSGAEWKTYTSSFIAEGTTTYIRVGANSGGGGVSYWDKIEVYEAVWADLTGQGGDGVINGIDGLSAESGAGGTKSFDFDGSSDYISLDTSAYDAVKGGEITVGAWIKRDVDSGVYDGIVSTHVNTAEGFALLISGAHDTLFWQFDGTSGQINTSSAITIELNKWYYVVGTYSGGTLNTYVDGSPDEQGTASSATVLGGTDLPIFVGAQRSGLGVMGAPFNGKIAIVHMYNRALTAAEIQQNYRTHKGRFGK